MKIRAIYLITAVVIAIFSCHLFAQSRPGRTSSKVSKQAVSSVVGLTFMNIAPASDRCVFVAGYSQRINGLFINSCVDGWSVKEVPSVGYVTDASFSDSADGWMIVSGSLARIQGNALSPVKLGDEENAGLNSVWTTDDQHVYAVGRDGRVVWSANAGLSWNGALLDKDFELNEVVFSSSRGWIVGAKYEGGRRTGLTLFNTNDGGLSWNRLDQQQGNELERIFFLDADHGWAITSRRAVAVSSDGGKTWSLDASAGTNFSDLVFVDHNRGWAIDQTTLYSTVDGGKTWKEQFKLPDSSPYNFERVIFLDAKNGWLWSQGMILQSKDAGATWARLDISGGIPRKRLK